MITAHPKVRIQYLRDSQAVYTANGAEGLRYATSGSVGLDLRACLEEDEAAIPAGGRLAIPSGIAVEPLTPGIAGFVYSRSGLGAMQGLTVAQGVGVIDPDYRGEITVVLLNTSNEERRLRRGDRIAQLVFQPALQVVPVRTSGRYDFFGRRFALQVELEECETLGATGRGSGGFGHTGKH